MGAAFLRFMRLCKVLKCEERKGARKDGRQRETHLDHVVALLANLALTSRNFNCSLRRYAVSGSAQKRFAKETGVGTVPALTSMTPEDPFYAWGKFLKSITITESVFDRIEYFNIFYAKFAEQWDFDECARLMRSLLATTENGLYRTMCEVLGGEGGQHPVSEMKVRRGLRELFLEHQYSDARDLSFWLSAILRTQFQVCCQARLMYVLFGPTKINDVSEEVIDWRGPCEVPISTYHNSKQRLGPLSDAFLRLLQTKYIGVSEFAYAEADVFNLLEEITTYPEPWSFDNFAALLLNRPGLIPVALVFRVVCGYHEEAGEVFSVMKSLLHRWHVSLVSYLEHPMRCTMRTLSPLQRVALLRSILKAVRDAILQTLDIFPDQRNEFIQEVRAADAAGPLLTILASVI
ncbi:unnamed protein product [Toxocara canis]|uniref:FBXO47 ARM repeats region domain-containing protein n=1 Tax=Toxocara canis TaxID=6265 RepID=A0A183UTT9_TOXCA|nr:unnamed protein product [Toxocara canis]